MAFVGRLNPNTADSVADLVALINQNVIFVFSNGLGVAQGMGRQGPVGIKAQDVHIDACTWKIQVLLLESEHLHRLETIDQRNAIAVFPSAAFTGTVEALGIELHQSGQTIPQSRPLLVGHQTRLNEKGVGEFAAGQHPAFAIQQPPADGRAGHQANAILIRCHLVLSTMKQLHPNQPHTNGAKKGKQQQQNHSGLLAHTAIAGVTAIAETGHGRSSSSR